MKRTEFRCDICGQRSQSGQGFPDFWYELSYTDRNKVKHTYHFDTPECGKRFFEEKIQFLAGRRDSAIVTAFEEGR